MTQRLSYLSALLIAILALVYALWGIDLHELWQLLRRADYRMLGPCLFLLSLFYWLKARRWVLILRPLGEYTSRQVMPSLMIGFGTNNVLPAHLGELLRTIVFARRYHKPLTGVFMSLVLERLFDTVSILLLFLAASLMLDEAMAGLRITAWLTAGVLIAACIFLYVASSRPDLIISLWDALSTRFTKTLRERGRHELRNIISVVSSIDSYGTLAVLLMYSLMQWALMAAFAWFAIWAFDTVVSPSVVVILLGVVVFAVAVPNAPGYIGAIQAAFVFALTPFGVAQEVAFASSVLFLVAQWVPVTAIGAFYFVGTGLHVAEARCGIEEIKHSD